MPNKPRKMSTTGIHHVVWRGNNKQQIFEEKSDCVFFLRALAEAKKEYGIEIHACCLMDNHIHILIKENPEEGCISLFMQKVAARFVGWYNKKYQRVGHLFQGRFYSEPVENLEYYRIVFRYIHRNPITQGMERKLGQYKWNSYGFYRLAAFEAEKKRPPTQLSQQCMKYWVFGGRALIDVNCALEAFGDYDVMLSFCRINNEDACLDIDFTTCHELADANAKRTIAAVSGCNNVSEFQKLTVYDRRRYVKDLLERGLPKNQIRRLCGVSQHMVNRIAKTITR